MSRFWSQEVHALTPYVPGEQPQIDNLIKLNTNENPYGPSPKALAAIQAATDASLRLYPDPQGTSLRQAVAKHTGLSPEQVFVGNGSDEVLALAFQAFFKQELPLLFPDISYSFYPVYAQMYQITAEQIPLAEDFTLRIEDYKRPNGGIIFPNPNAPTGIALSLAAIREILEANPNSVVLVDEAYVDFGAESAASLVNEFPNLLVTQTLSKSWALAGLRVGFALGNSELIEGLVRLKDSFNSYPLDRLALAGAQAALEDQEYFQASCAKIISEREKLSQELTQLGFRVLPSKANFVFASHEHKPATDLAQQLRENALLVRHFQQPRIKNFLRISLGTPADNAKLVEVLRQLVQA